VLESIELTISSTVPLSVTACVWSEMSAADIIWNFRRVYDDKSPQYDAPAAPIVRATLSMLDTFEKADDKTIVLTTKFPFSFLPYLLPRLLIVSPTQWEKVGKTWAEFAKQPSGTGPGPGGECPHDDGDAQGRDAEQGDHEWRALGGDVERAHRGGAGGVRQPPQAGHHEGGEREEHAGEQAAPDGGGGGQDIPCASHDSMAPQVGELIHAAAARFHT